VFSLLSLWQKYVDIIYAPEGEIDLLKQLQEEGGEFSSPAHAGGIADAHFANKLKSETDEERLKTLFAKTKDEMDSLAAKP